MRLVEIRVGESSRDQAEQLLDDRDIDFVTVPTATGDGFVVSFPIPPQGVETVLDALDDAALGEEYRVVATAETASTEHMQTLEDRFLSSNGERDNVALAEIRSRALDMNPSALTYYAMTVFSAIVATAGLLLDAPTIVVGSMVIAPQVGAAMTTGVGTVVNDRTMISDGLKSQLFGLTAAVFAAMLFGFGLKTAEFVPPAIDLTTAEQISKRVSPGLLSLAVGLCAGAAGAFGLATALPVSLVGVMIAAALIPAAAAVGIGIAWGLPAITAGALVLLVVNVVSINLTTIGVLWGLDYRPPEWDARDLRSRAGVRDVAPLLLTMALFLAAFAGAGLVISEQVQTTNQVNDEVSDVLERQEYRALELHDVHIEFDSVVTESSPRSVSLTIERPSGQRYPNLARTIDTQLTATLGEPVAVEVRFEPRQRTE
jgi:uncharacterized hydrophobic protein (TIGR00271 family)